MIKGRGIPTLRIALVALISALAVVGALHSNGQQAAEAKGALLSFPASDCSTDSAQLTFNWHPVAGVVERMGTTLYVRDHERLSELAEGGAAQMLAAR